LQYSQLFQVVCAALDHFAGGVGEVTSACRTRRLAKGITQHIGCL
jgi:hypothetical protein